MFFFRPAIKLRLPWTRRCCDNQCIKSPSNSLNLLQKARRFLTTRIQYDGLQLGYASCFATSSTDCVATSRDVWELKGFVITRLHSQNERSFPEQIFWSLLTLDNTLRFKNLLSDFEAPTEKHNNSQKTPTNLHPKKKTGKTRRVHQGVVGDDVQQNPPGWRHGFHWGTGTSFHDFACSGILAGCRSSFRGAGGLFEATPKGFRNSWVEKDFPEAGHFSNPIFWMVGGGMMIHPSFFL